MKDVVTTIQATHQFDAFVWTRDGFFYLQLYYKHDLLPEYERYSYVGSLKFLCICAFGCENEMNSQPAYMMESGEVKERRATITDNHHRSNKSKRFIANGGFEYIYLAILFSSIHSTNVHEIILIHLNHFINVRQEKYTPRQET